MPEDETERVRRMCPGCGAAGSRLPRFLCWATVLLRGADRNAGRLRRAATALDLSDPEAEAARALDRGDLDGLGRLAERMLASSAELPARVGCRPLGSDVDLARSFRSDVEHRARKIGLRAAGVEVDVDCAEYLSCCCVWGPSVPARPLDLETKASHGLPAGHHTYAFVVDGARVSARCR